PGRSATGASPRGRRMIARAATGVIVRRGRPARRPPLLLPLLLGLLLRAPVGRPMRRAVRDLLARPRAEALPRQGESLVPGEVSREEEHHPIGTVARAILGD